MTVLMMQKAARHAAQASVLHFWGPSRWAGGGKGRRKGKRRGVSGVSAACGRVNELPDHRRLVLA